MTDDTDPRPFLSRPATTMGRRAGWSALTGVVALLVANLVFRDAGGSADGVRAALILLFAAGGVSALVHAARAIMANDRGILVWAYGLFGLAATLLMLAEFTIME